MPLEILQLLSLVTRGNYYLSGDNHVREDYYPTHLYFSGCKEVIFQKTSDTDTELTTLTYPPAWFEELKTSGAQSLRFAHYQPPLYLTDTGSRPQTARMTAGFVGGMGTNSIEVHYSDGVEFWIPKWTSIESMSPDERTSWYVIYQNTLGRKPPHTHEYIDVPLQKEKLGTLLDELISFSTKDPALTHWQSRFEHAKEMLACTDFSNDEVISELFPTDHHVHIELQQLLASAVASFVFGAMGSWNDITLTDAAREQEYVRLSDELYECIWNCLDAINLPFHSQDLPTPTPTLP